MGKKHKKKSTIPLLPTVEKARKYKIAPEKPKYIDKKPAFAFNYYEDRDKIWSFRCVTDCKNFHILFRNLKNMGSFTWGQIKGAHQFDAHEIPWGHMNLPECIKKLARTPEMTDLSLFQFKAFDEKSRIIGLINYNAVFEIICIDLNHKVYPSDG